LWKVSLWLSSICINILIVSAFVNFICFDYVPMSKGPFSVFRSLMCKLWNNSFFLCWVYLLPSRYTYYSYPNPYVFSCMNSLDWVHRIPYILPFSFEMGHGVPIAFSFESANLERSKNRSLALTYRCSERIKEAGYARYIVIYISCICCTLHWKWAKRALNF